jgi:LysR family glycine cleavage system transcriptional activator
MPESPVPRRLPPLNALVAFEAAARAGGVGRAAEALRVAQPAVSRHIRNLEGWLGAELFRREANRVRLTETGAALAVEVGAALDRIEAAAARAREPAPREVRLGCSTGMAYQWAMPRLPDLRRALPEIGVALVVADDYAEFDARGVDLSLRFGNGRWPGRRADLLIPESDAPVAAPALIARRPELEPPVDPSRLDPTLLLHYRGFDGGWRDWPRWFEAAGHPAPDIGAPAALRGERNYSVLVAMAIAGEGVALGALGLLTDPIARGALRVLAPPLGRSGFGYWLLSPEDGADPTAAAVRDWLVSEADATPASAAI